MAPKKSPARSKSPAKTPSKAQRELKALEGANLGPAFAPASATRRTRSSSPAPTPSRPKASPAKKAAPAKKGGMKDVKMMASLLGVGASVLGALFYYFVMMK